MIRLLQALTQEQSHKVPSSSEELYLNKDNGKIYIGTEEIRIEDNISPDSPTRVRDLVNELYNRGFFYMENKIIDDYGNLCLVDPDPSLQINGIPTWDRSSMNGAIIKNYDRAEKVYEVFEDTALLEVDLMRNVGFDLKFEDNQTNTFNFLDFARKLVIPRYFAVATVTCIVEYDGGNSEQISQKVDLFVYDSEMSLKIKSTSKNDPNNKLVFEVTDDGNLYVFPIQKEISNCYISSCNVKYNSY